MLVKFTDAKLEQAIMKDVANGFLLKHEDHTQTRTLSRPPKKNLNSTSKMKAL